MKKLTTILGLVLIVSTVYANAAAPICSQIFSDTAGAATQNLYLDRYEAIYNKHLPYFQKSSDQLLQALLQNKDRNFNDILNVFLTKIETTSSKEEKINAHYGIEILSMFGTDTSLGFGSAPANRVSTKAQMMLEIMALSGKYKNQTLGQMLTKIYNQQGILEEDLISSNRINKTENIVNLSVLRALGTDLDMPVELNKITTDLLDEAESTHQQIHSFRKRSIIDNLERANKLNHFELTVRLLLNQSHKDNSPERAELTYQALNLLAELGQDTSSSRYVAPAEHMGFETKKLIDNALLATDTRQMQKQIDKIMKVLEIRTNSFNQNRKISVENCVNLSKGS